MASLFAHQILLR